MTRLIAAVRIFVSGAWLSYIALFRWTRPVPYLVSKIIAPFNSILFFTLLGTSASGSASAQFYIIGNAMQVVALNGIYGVTQSVGRERSDGTLIYVLITPANRFVMFLGRAFFHVIDGMITVVLGFFWGAWLLGLNLSHTNFLGLAVTILVCATSTCGLGLLLGALSLVSLNVAFVNNTAYLLLLLFSGANVTLSNLPLWMQYISFCLPLGRGITAARLLVGGASVASVSSLLIGELLIGLIFAVAGFIFFSVFEHKARIRGTLEAV